MPRGKDTRFDTGRQGDREAHSNRQRGTLAPSGDMGYPELNAKVKEAKPMPAGGAAPEGTTKVFQAPSSVRGYGQAAYAVPDESMPGIKEHYRDLRTGTNNSGKNAENQTMSRSNARQSAIVGGNGHQTMIQDAYAKPTTNSLGVSY